MLKIFLPTKKRASIQLYKSPPPRYRPDKKAGDEGKTLMSTRLCPCFWPLRLRFDMGLRKLRVKSDDIFVGFVCAYLVSLWLYTCRSCSSTKVGMLWDLTITAKVYTTLIRGERKIVTHTGSLADVLLMKIDRYEEIKSGHELIFDFLYRFLTYFLLQCLYCSVSSVPLFSFRHGVTRMKLGKRMLLCNKKLFKTS